LLCGIESAKSSGEMTALLTLAYRCQGAIITWTLQRLRRYDVRGFLAGHLSGSDLSKVMELEDEGQPALHM
jgi:hypothetical protein